LRNLTIGEEDLFTDQNFLRNVTALGYEALKKASLQLG